MRNFDIVKDEKLGGVIFAEALKRERESKIRGSFVSELNGVIDEASTLNNGRTYSFVSGAVAKFRKERGEAISEGRKRIKDKKRTGIKSVVKPTATDVDLGQSVHLEATRRCKKDKSKSYNVHLGEVINEHCRDHNFDKDFVENCVSAYWVSLKDMKDWKKEKDKPSLAAQPTVNLAPSLISLVRLYRLWLENNATIPCDSFFTFFGLTQKSPMPIDDLKNVRSEMMKDGYEFESVPGQNIIKVTKRPDTLEDLMVKLVKAKANNDREAYVEVMRKLISVTPTNDVPSTAKKGGVTG
jgi:hypothetical protein